jgi:bifunctional ADP-heptose synthase (sugar kinase/adenylyltransferase)
VLVVGEAIIDEYQYCEEIGKTSKEPVIAMKSMHAQRFAGGILAVANHVASFCDRVGMLTFLGDTDSQEDFVREKLNPRIEAAILYRKDSPTIVKRRFIEYYFFRKMLELYTINDAELAPGDNRALCAKLEELVPQYDVVIVVDFGHSMMTKEAIEIVAGKAKFLAVNAQANAGNMGYNVISKYPRADYITLAEKEMRLEARDHRGDARRMLEDVAKKMQCERAAVTQGRNGSLCYSRSEGFFLVPALAREVVDRVGAGDAFLSVSALCAALKAPMEVVGFIGNAVGAWKVGIVCNERAVDRVLLFKQIETLLK